MAGSDRDRFMAALARASVGTIPTADQATHERVARETVAANPDLCKRALETGNYLPLIRIAKNAKPGLVEFWLAQRIGQLVRGGFGCLTPSPFPEQSFQRRS